MLVTATDESAAMATHAVRMKTGPTCRSAAAPPPAAEAAVHRPQSTASETETDCSSPEAILHRWRGCNDCPRATESRASVWQCLAVSGSVWQCLAGWDAEAAACTPPFPPPVPVHSEPHRAEGDAVQRQQQRRAPLLTLFFSSL